MNNQTPPTNTGNPRFRFDEIFDEIDGFSVTATPYLTKSGPTVLSQLREGLESVRASNPGETQWWGIRDKLPLETKPSRGDYELQRTTRDVIFARVTAKWGIRVVKQGHGIKARELFEVCESASVIVELRDYEQFDDKGKNKLVWCWRFELGDPAHPGCFFHTQLGSNVKPEVAPMTEAQPDVVVQSSTVPVEQDISVPRLPTLVFTPISAADFVLGELFQKDWAEAASQDNQDVNRWSKVHAKFLTALLEWKLTRVKRRTVGSPWLWLKCHKPENDLFTRLKLR